MFSIILPAGHQKTERIIRHYHETGLYAGPQVHLAWSVNGIESSRMPGAPYVRRSAAVFTALDTKQPRHPQKMGDLPAVRVLPAHPFQNVDIDYACPIVTCQHNLRTKRKLKSYIAVFVCMCTKSSSFGAG